MEKKVSSMIVLWWLIVTVLVSEIKQPIIVIYYGHMPMIALCNGFELYNYNNIYAQWKIV